MGLHLQKLSVGAQSISSLRDWQAQLAKKRRAKGLSPHPIHVTRMFPKRRDELLDGGSIYWVIKGAFLCRNRILDLEETSKGGRRACAIVMAPELIPVLPTPRRAFQGWRYLQVADAPLDLDRDMAGDMPPELRIKLLKLGAW